MVLVSNRCVYTLVNMSVPHVCMHSSEGGFESAHALNICDCAGDGGFGVCRKVCMCISGMTVSCMVILCMCLLFCGM